MHIPHKDHVNRNKGKSIVVVQPETIALLNSHSLELESILDPVIMMETMSDKKFLEMLWYSKSYILKGYKFIDLPRYYKNAMKHLSSVDESIHSKLNTLCTIRPTPDQINRLKERIHNDTSGIPLNDLVKFITSGQNKSRSIRDNKGFSLITLNSNTEALVPVTDFITLLTNRQLDSTLARVLSDKFTYTVMVKAASGSIFNKYMKSKAG